MEQNDRIIEMARALGRAIQMDERYEILDKAREATDTDTALQDAIGRFNLSRINLNAEMAKEEQDKDKVAEINSDMQRAYGEVMDSELMIQYEAAKGDINDLITWVNAIITTAINGGDPNTVQQPAACGGDCGGCAGCS